MVSRTTDDYERMALAGCVAITEPAFWAGFDRTSAQGFFDYFRTLTDYEPMRARPYGIAHHTWLCINPKEAEDMGLAREVLEIIPDFLKKPNVLGIGEIGLNKNSRNELKVFEEHVAEIASHRGALVEQGRVDRSDELIQMVIEPEHAEVLDVGRRVLIVE